jgi:hypothetical protein
LSRAAAARSSRRLEPLYSTKDGANEPVSAARRRVPPVPLPPWPGRASVGASPQGVVRNS